MVVTIYIYDYMYIIYIYIFKFIFTERGTTGVRKKQFTTSAKAIHPHAAFSYAHVTA